LVLTDIVMPGQSGIQLVKALRETRASIAVIYMSAYSEQTLAGQEFTEAHLLITKPFDQNALLGRIRHTLDHPPQT
jgi:CheY-like chemotaxis protein